MGRKKKMESWGKDKSIVGPKVHKYDWHVEP